MVRMWLVGMLTAGVVVVGGSAAVAGETWQEAEFVDLNLEVIDFVWDEVRGEVHAITTATDPRYPKHLVSVDPLSGEIVSAVPFGVDPDILAMTDDGKYVYVGLWWVGHIVRVDMSSRSVDLSVKIADPLYPGGDPIFPSGAKIFAMDVVTLEDEPESFAVIVGSNSTPGVIGIQVFDGASPRPEMSELASWAGLSLIRGDHDVLYGGSQTNLIDSLIDSTGVAAERSTYISMGYNHQVADFGDDYLLFGNSARPGTSLDGSALIVDVITGTPVELPLVPVEGHAQTATYDDRTASALWSGNERYDDLMLLIEETDPYSYLRLSRTEVAGAWGDDDLYEFGEPKRLVRIDEGHFVVAMDHPRGLIRVAVTNSVDASPVGIVDIDQGYWTLRDRWGFGTSFYFGNPGDYPFMGDWDCDGNETPGLYRQSDGYVYLRNSNSQGVADIKFFFGDPGDVPLAGDFNGDGCDTVSIYRPSEAQFYIINELGSNDGGLGAADYSFLFGNQGDKPVVGDWDGDGIDEIGLHRESTGFFYYRNTLNTGNASDQFYFGNPGDYFIAGDSGPIPDGVETPAIFRPSDGRIYFRYENTQGKANGNLPTWGDEVARPVAGEFDLLIDLLSAQGQFNAMSSDPTGGRPDFEPATGERSSPLLHDPRSVAPKAHE